MARLVLIAVDAPHFYAGAIYDVDRDRVVNCAPILRRDLMSKTRADVRLICKRKGWRTHVVDGGEQLSMID